MFELFMHLSRLKGYKGEKTFFLEVILTDLLENKLCCSNLVELNNTPFCLLLLLTDLRDNKLTFSALGSGISLPK